MSNPRKRQRTPGSNPARTIAARPSKDLELPVRDNNGPKDRLVMIADAAYFHAEKRNFCPGHELDDWLAAEREIDAALSAAGIEAHCG